MAFFSADFFTEFFDIGGIAPEPTPQSFGGGYFREPYPRPPELITDDDDDILLAWFMFMMQPYER